MWLLPPEMCSRCAKPTPAFEDFKCVSQRLCWLLAEMTVFWTHWVKQHSPSKSISLFFFFNMAMKTFKVASVANQASLGAQQERIHLQGRTWVWSLSQEDPLEKEMATPSSILAWEIPWTQEPGRLHFTGWRVGHNLATKQQPVANICSSGYVSYEKHWSRPLSAVMCSMEQKHHHQLGAC